jgi:hypothetical protein
MNNRGRCAAVILCVVALSASGVQQRLDDQRLVLTDLAGSYSATDAHGHSWHLTLRANGAFSSLRVTGVPSHDITQPTAGVASLSEDYLLLVADESTEALRPLRLGDRMYLLVVPDTLRFCIDLEQGREPRRSAIGRTLLRDGDERKEVPGGSRPDFCKVQPKGHS